VFKTKSLPFTTNSITVVLIDRVIEEEGLYVYTEVFICMYSGETISKQYQNPESIVKDLSIDRDSGKRLCFLLCSDKM
jgi:hypothetical protein